LKIREGLVKPAEASFTHWHAVAPHDHTLADVLQPGYLWRKHESIKVHDRVTIDHALHQFSVTLYVRAIDKEAQALLFFLDQVIDRTQQELTVPDLTGAEVDYRGALNWAVVQGAKTLKGGFDTKDEAEAWLKKKKAGVARSDAAALREED
jgi:hypothetical protein